ncbi:MAG: hypothetical protein H0U23_04725 [Blastocatellia bacterium]|nr:hypothetical protein [Blastocatellia bacterium]
MKKLDESTIGNLELACKITHAHAEKVRDCWNAITARVPNVLNPILECGSGEVNVYWGDRNAGTPVLTMVIFSTRNPEWTLVYPGFLDDGYSYPDDEVGLETGLSEAFFAHLKKLFCQKEDAPC